MLKYYIVIKHRTHLEELILKGKIACSKSISAVGKSRVRCKLKINMSRFTNPSYNLLAGSKIPNSISSVRNYVIFPTPDKLNTLTTGSRYKRGSSKLIMRQKRMEFGMVRNGKPWGSRRVHSTNHFIGKGPSYFSLDKNLPLGNFKSKQLEMLKSNIINGRKCTNLSIIMSDPNFLIAVWVKTRFESTGLTTTLNKKNTLDGIKISQFEKTANTIRNGEFQFLPLLRKYISKSNGKKKLLIVSPSKNKIVQEAMSFLLFLIFEGDFNGDSYGWVNNKGCHIALNQIKMKFSHNNWFIKGEIEQKFTTLNHQVIVGLLKEKIEDQAF